ncbi:MAG: hypothetical protein ABS81_10600 [Pseudonocardia sp. SCN 72-86]|nr:MAG: hypothetical protein ABS81_10600 [Pseudonocardia sp. SCN 72-86]
MAASSEPAFGDRQQVGEDGGSACAPGHEAADGLVDGRVRLAGGPSDEALQQVQGGVRAGGVAEGVDEPVQVAPQVGAGDVGVGELVGGHPCEPADDAGPQSDADDGAARRDVDVRGGGQRPEQRGRVAEDAADLRPARARRAGVGAASRYEEPATTPPCCQSRLCRSEYE